MSYQFWLLAIAVYWVATSLFAIKIAKKCFVCMRTFQKRQIPHAYQTYQAFMRQRLTPQHEKTIIKGCLLRFPLHFFLMTSFLVTYALLATLKKYIKLPKAVVEFYRTHAGRLVFRTCVKTAEQFDAYQKIETPIAISNHTSWLETIYFGSLPQPISSIGKEELSKLPIFSTITDYIRCIYVKRQSAESRQQAVQKIKDRVNKFNSKIEQCPLVIYPEGTVSNGKSLLKFKAGAFEPLSPITIFSFQFQCQQFHPQMADVKLVEAFILTLALRPSLVVKKAVIHAKEGQNVVQYQERCRQKLSQMGNFTKYEASFNDLKQFMNFMTQSSDGEAKMK